MLHKLDIYQRLCKSASECRACPNVFHEITYLNEKNGDIESPLLFIGEAPGFVQLKEERGMAFHGNQSGVTFEYLLKTIGLERSKVFVTNGLLHTPIKPSKKEYPGYGQLGIRPPSNTEIMNCGGFLKDQIKLVDPKIICTLGRKALDACTISLEEFPLLSLKKDVAQPFSWNGLRYVFPLYHTSPNVTASIRSLSQMEDDFKKLRGLMDYLEIEL